VFAAEPALGLDPGDAGKKIKGRKRHIITDTIGLLIGFVIHSAGIQDRDGAGWALKSIRYTHPWLRHVFADGGYGGPKLRGALEKNGCWTIEIVKRSDTAKGFEVIPRRWVVERTFAMASTLSQTGKGLGEINPFSRKLAPNRPHQTGNKEASKILKSCR